jgi:hypothetical protein
VPAVVIPIADRHAAYATTVKAALGDAGLRVEVDARGERMQAKIRDAQFQKVPCMLIVGDKEAESGRGGSPLTGPGRPGPATAGGLRGSGASGTPELDANGDSGGFFTEVMR